MAVLSKPYVPRPGSMRAKIVEFLRVNPAATLEQVTDFTTGNRGLASRILWNLRDEGVIKISPPISLNTRRIVKPGSALYDMIKGDLGGSLDSMTEIARRNSVSNTLVCKINREEAIRTDVVINHTYKAGFGLNPDKLPLVAPLSVSEKEKIFRENSAYMDKILREFPAEARPELEKRARARIWNGLARYSPDLMLPQHFVMLVTQRAAYEYIFECGRAIGLKQRQPPRRSKFAEAAVRERPLTEPECKRLGKAITDNMNVLKSFVKERTFPEETDDVVQRAVVKAYECYDPERDQNVKNFLIGMARKAIGEEKNSNIAYKFMRLGLYNQMKLLPEIQNRPKNTDPARQLQDHLF